MAEAQTIGVRKKNQEPMQEQSTESGFHRGNFVAKFDNGLKVTFGVWLCYKVWQSAVKQDGYINIAWNTVKSPVPSIIKLGTNVVKFVKWDDAVEPNKAIKLFTYAAAPFIGALAVKDALNNYMKEQKESAVSRPSLSDHRMGEENNQNGYLLNTNAWKPKNTDTSKQKDVSPKKDLHDNIAALNKGYSEVFSIENLSSYATAGNLAFTTVFAVGAGVGIFGLLPMSFMWQSGLVATAWYTGLIHKVSSIGYASYEWCKSSHDDYEMKVAGAWNEENL